MALIEFEEPETMRELAAMLDNQASTAEEVQARNVVYRGLADTNLPLNPATRQVMEQIADLLAAATDLIIQLPNDLRAELDV